MQHISIRLWLLTKFTISIAILTMTLSCGNHNKPSSSETAYASGEHTWLGDTAFNSTCKVKCINQFPVKDRSYTFTYGELTSLGGDFYSTPEEMYEESTGSFWEITNDVKLFRRQVFKELIAIEEYIENDSQDEYPDCEALTAVAYPQYLSLALENYDHFGYLSIAKYTKFHEKALDLAIKANQEINERKKQELYNQSIYVNAYADHYLIDSFSAGHLRVPRKQIITWSKSVGWNSITAGILSDILHDNDGNIRKIEDSGIWVENANGDKWIARGDHLLFWNNDPSHSSIRVPLEAMKASLEELHNAYTYGQKPEKKFTALSKVPFISNMVEPIIEAFPPNMSDNRIKEIMDSLPFYRKITYLSGIDETILKRFLNALPYIMKAYRSDIKQHISNSPLIQKRVPEVYLEAYQKVR